ncbi:MULTISPECIES: hypothetical protein [Corynebacterium]|uniref:hypothetical protein n=1 Tax=Corynebacterium TaxID=1716 RepID=UPI0008A6107D|nr:MULTISPECIES: hypothetical protein [Corynebacterium]MCG7277749.1 hypothetical protein [Corynebacterium imitans]OFP36120.1 hypothetical protein HMPREF2990_06970 [Corynebacterium sp. HMSC071B10]OHF36233.1 hypothetical protein HMPREF2550_09060 [Corynebacterium sp. HMSC074A01]
MKATYPVAAATVAALAVAGLSPVSAQDKPQTSPTPAATATATPSATATPTTTTPTSSATPEGPTPVTVTVTAPAVTATTTPFRATGPSSEWINKGALDERGQEIFTYISFALSMIGGLLQAAAFVAAASPNMQAQLKAMLARVGIK